MEKQKSMKKHVILLVLLTAVYSANAQTPAPEAQLKQMEWLLGGWNRVNSPVGKSGYEYWQRKAEREWHGRGISMKGADTTFVEILKIVVEKNKLYYVADVPGNNKPVYFEITSVTEGAFICENPSHDFPKRIEYRYDGKQIRARVSAGAQGMDYVFERRP